MNYNEFAEKIKTKYPDYADMDNMELAKKMVAKFPDEYSDVTFDETNQSQGNFFTNFGKGLVQGVSDLGVNLGKNIANKKLRPLLGKEPLSDEKLDKTYGFLDDKPIGAGGNVGKFIGGVAPYMALPEVKAVQGVGFGAKLANNALTGAYQGGLIGGLEGFAQGENPLKSAGAGAGIGASLTAGLPIAGKLAVKGLGLIPNSGGLVARTLGRVQPETLKRAIQPDSKALDLDKAQAENLLMNTTERVKQTYNDLLNQKGNVVGELLAKLPDNYQYKAGDILRDYDKIYSNYSLSGNEALNPAINATKKELEKIKSMLYSNEKRNVDAFNSDMDLLPYPKGKIDVVRGKRKGEFYTQTLNNMDNAITFAQRKFNSDVLGKIKNNPDLVYDPKAIQHFEDVIEDIRTHVPDEVANDMYNKFFSAIEATQKLNKENYTVNPKELYDINKNISDMVDWKATDAKTKNAILEQMYGANAERISNLSPQLKDANKEFSDLANFRQNEGLSRVLANNEKIDNASTALRNYNSTVTKGNTNRNIQDLEKTFVENGYQPFLNDIDDVNASMDLLNIRGTGDSWLANLVTQTTKPALRGVRGLNRFIQKNGLGKIYQQLNQETPRYITPLLYGGIEENDYRY